MPKPRRGDRNAMCVPGPMKSVGNKVSGSDVNSLVGICQYRYIVNVGKVSKPLYWIGTSRDDLSDFPDAVKHHVGLALRFAQWGDKHHDSKPLKGFGGAGTLEVVTVVDGSAYRTVYTVKFKGAVYVLHAFQKKSNRGIKTPKEELDLVKARLKRAEAHYDEWSKDNVEEND